MTEIFSFLFSKKKVRSSPVVGTEGTSNNNVTVIDSEGDGFTILETSDVLTAYNENVHVNNSVTTQANDSDYETLFSFMKVDGDPQVPGGVPVRPIRKAPAPPPPIAQQSLMMMTPIICDSNPMMSGVPFCLHRNLSAKYAFNDISLQLHALGTQLKSRNDSAYFYDFQVEMEVVHEGGTTHNSNRNIPTHVALNPPNAVAM